MTQHERSKLIETMALAIANQFRAEKKMHKVKSLAEIENVGPYRRAAAAGLDAYLRERLGH